MVRVSDFWQWSNQVYLPSLYNLDWYNYTGRPEALFIGDFGGHVIGVARLRQVRIKTGKLVQPVSMNRIPKSRN